MGAAAAVIPVVKTVATVIGAVSSVASFFGGAPEAPSLPPPPPTPEPLAPPPAPEQVTKGAKEALADEQARNRTIRQRRAAAQSTTRPKNVTTINTKTTTLLGE